MNATPRGAGDVGYVIRTLARHPLFSGSVIATLAVAIGANVAIFAIVNALVFRPFPFPAVDRLVTVSSTPRSAIRRLGVSFPDYAEWQERARSFDAIGLAGGRSFLLNGTAGPAAVVDGARATAGVFRVIGLAPLLGRAFTAEEDHPGGAAVVVLGQVLWERAFGGDPAVLGRVIRLDGRDHMVIGVMPRDFAFPDHAELWVPMGSDPLREDRAARGYAVMARLRPGVTVDAAAAELKRIAAGQAAEHPATNRDVDVLASSLAGVRGPRGLVFALLVALGAGGFVLLIACANVANLLLARMASRAKELAIRTALGATRARVVKLLLVEGLALTVPGGVFGLLVGQAGRDALIAMIPSGIPTWMRFDTDWRVLAFTLALSAAASLGTILSPGLRATRRPAIEAIKESGGGSQTGAHRMRGALVVSEVALTFVLLVGASLMVRTFVNATRVDPGFRPAGLLTLRLPLPASTYPPERRAPFFDGLAARIASLPGVSSVGLASQLPLGGTRSVEYQADGMETQVPPTKPLVMRCVVSEAFFRTAAMPLVAGRTFDSRDGAGAQKVAIVSRALAEREWPHGEAIGRRLRFPGDGSDAPWLTVVGVVGDIRYWRLEGDQAPWIYVPLAQGAPPAMALVVRSADDPAILADAVRAEVATADPDLPILDVLPFEGVIRRSLWAERLFTRVFEVFGFVALGLAVIGIYGVVSYSAGQRTREIGIRAALGANRRSLAWLVLRDGARLALTGVALGAAGAYAATRAMAGLLYGVSPHDAWTFAAVSLSLLAVAVASSYLPARRAARMDPLRALREG